MTSDSLIDRTVVLEAVSGALGDIVAKYRDLLILQAHELALVHRFGAYLEERLREDLRRNELTIDLDYDRHLDHQKWLPPRPDRSEDDPRRFRPDLILHRRGKDTHNILVVEWKKNASHSVVESLEKRINRLLDEDEHRSGYRYLLGVLVDSSDTGVRWRAFGCSHSLDGWQSALPN